MTSPVNEHTITPSQNLELKVRIDGNALEQLHRRLDRMHASAPDIQHQEDTYFAVPDGRLKLRRFRSDRGDHRTELIAYRRPDVQDSRWSTYRLMSMTVEEGAELTSTLSQVLPVLVRVRKRRSIRLYKATRIHLDQVEGLGSYVELETVISNQGRSEAHAEHQDVIDRLALSAWPAQAGSYSDLLMHRQRN